MQKKTIIKSFKFRIFPDKETAHFLICQFGCCRWVFNNALEQINDHFEKTGKFLNAIDTNRALPKLKRQEETKWLGDVMSQPLQVAGQCAETAFKNFFSKKAKRPKFKSRKAKQCFMVPQGARIEDGLLRLPKIKKGIKIILSREIQGRVMHVHISKNPAGQFFASFTCEVEIEQFEKTGKQTGVDVGLKSAAILSDGQKFENAKPLRTLEKKLKHEQKKLSRQQKGSRSWERQRQKVARLHNKIRNIRHDNIHKITTTIVKSHDAVVVETLAVKNMMQNHHLAKAFSDAALGELQRQLKFKCEWHGRVFIPIGRFFASSQLCHVCGWQNKDLQLKDREWTCSCCHTHHDRDVNAAKNILNEGLNIQSGCGTQSD